MAKCLTPDCVNHTPVPLTVKGKTFDVSDLQWCLRCIAKWRKHDDSDYCRYNHDTNHMGYRIALGDTVRANPTPDV
jgi:hypothetical protein